MKTGARFSECKKYRYLLWRIWNDNAPLLAFCMLNPSTADETQNDPTVERCQRRTEQMGYGGLIVVNIFAYRSTDPLILRNLFDPIGPENDMAIILAVGMADKIICGWGKHGSLHDRGRIVLNMIKFLAKKQPLALKINKDGSPAHPLYIHYKRKPIPIDLF